MPVSFYDKKGALQTVDDDYNSESGENMATSGLRAKGYQTGQMLVGSAKSKKPGGQIFVPDEEISEAFGSGNFETAALQSAKAAPIEVGIGETAARGLSQGLTLGMGDEAQAGIRALFSDKSYGQLRDEDRAINKDAAEQNPGTMMTSELVGGLAGGVAGGAKTLAGLTRQGAAMGAAAGFGTGEGDALSQGLSTVGGAAVGGLAPVALKGLGAVASKGSDLLKSGAKRAIGSAADLSQDSINYYLKNPELVNAARPLEDVARDVTRGLGKAKQKIQQMSGESRNILERQNVGITKDSITARMREIADDLIRKAKTPEMAKDAEKLIAQADFLDAQPGKAIAGGDLKDLLQQLGDKAYASKVEAGGFDTPLALALKKSRSEIDDSAKWLSSDYKNQMSKTAEATQMLENVKPRFKNNQASYNTLKGIARDKSPFQAEYLTAMDEFLGSNLSKQARASGIKSAFEASTINGSRNVNLGGRVGEAAGGFGNAIGAVLGYAKDRIARPAAKGTLDIGLVLEPYAKQLGKYYAPLSQAAARGPSAVLLTHQLLMKDPGYIKLISPEESK